MTQARYHDLTIRPEILHDIPLATFYLRADPSVMKAALPEGLVPAPNGRLILNIWSQDDPNETTGFGGFGPMGIAYLAIEVAEKSGRTSDGKARFPARFWKRHWCNYEPARRYAAMASGLQILPGSPSATVEGSQLRGRLELDGEVVNEVSANLDLTSHQSTSGYSVYCASRENRAGELEIAEFEIPWVGKSFSASDGKVVMSPVQANPAITLLGGSQPEVLSVGFRRMTLVPYLASAARCSSEAVTT